MLDYLRIMIAARTADNERGASAVEYGLLIAGIAALIVVVVFAFGDNLTGHLRRHLRRPSPAAPAAPPTDSSSNGFIAERRQAPVTTAVSTRGRSLRSLAGPSRSERGASAVEYGLLHRRHRRTDRRRRLRLRRQHR